MHFLRRLLSAVRIGRPGNLSPRCAVCGQVAAKIELSRTPDAWLLKYSGPGGSNGSGDPVSAAKAEVILRAFTPPYDAAKIRAAEFYDDAGFCIDCAKFYCPTHWSVSSIGSGRCPRGHFKSLDPHWSPD